MNLFNRKTSGVLVIVAVLLPFLVPSPGWITAVLPWLLGIILFFNFLNLDLRAVRAVKELLYYPLAGSLLVPGIVFIATTGLDAGLRAGLVLLAAAPSAASSPVVADLINADRPLSIILSVSSNLLAPLVIAAALGLYAGDDAATRLELLPMLIKVLSAIAVPLVAALLVGRIPIARNVRKLARPVNALAFPLIIFSALAGARGEISGYSGTSLLITAGAAALLCLISFGSGLVAPGSLPVKKSVALLFGHKNTALAIWIAVSFVSPGAAAPAVFYIIFHHLMNAALIWRARHA